MQGVMRRRMAAKHGEMWRSTGGWAMHEAMPAATQSGTGRSGWRARQVEVGLVAALAYLATVVLLFQVAPAGLAVMVGLTVLVLIHEGGHLVAARRCGVDVEEFFAGFGPVVVAWRTREGLRVGLKAIPAGGYVKVVGMSAREVVDPAREASTFRAATRLRRLAIVSAGPIVNLVFGFFLLVGASMVEGGASLPQALVDAWQWTSEVTTGTLRGLA